MLKSSTGYGYDLNLVGTWSNLDFFFHPIKVTNYSKIIRINYKMAVTCKNTIQCIVEEFENFQVFCIYSPITHESHLY